VGQRETRGKGTGYGERSRESARLCELERERGRHGAEKGVARRVCVEKRAYNRYTWAGV